MHLPIPRLPLQPDSAPPMLAKKRRFFLVQHQVLLVIDIDDGKSGPVFEETLD